jgi:hypothetical protein
MKKFFALLTATLFIVAVSFAQSTTPRFGTGIKDNTGRTLTYAYVTTTDAAGADSTTLNPNAWQTIVRVALVDSIYYKSPVVTRSYAGDKITIVASGASGKFIKFAGTNFISAGTATLSSGGRAVIGFVFDGAKWVEAYRTVQ